MGKGVYQQLFGGAQACRFMLRYAIEKGENAGPEVS
jgi:hypothetical protein